MRSLCVAVLPPLFNDGLDSGAFLQYLTLFDNISNSVLSFLSNMGFGLCLHLVY